MSRFLDWCDVEAFEERVREIQGFEPDDDQLESLREYEGWFDSLDPAERAYEEARAEDAGAEWCAEMAAIESEVEALEALARKIRPRLVAYPLARDRSPESDLLTRVRLLANDELRGLPDDLLERILALLRLVEELETDVAHAEFAHRLRLGVARVYAHARSAVALRSVQSRPPPRCRRIGVSARPASPSLRHPRARRRSPHALGARASSEGGGHDDHAPPSTPPPSRRAA